MKLLKADKRYNRPEDGFSLYQDGFRTFIGMSYIDKLIMMSATHQTMLAILNMKKEEEYMNPVVPLAVKGHYVIGSQLKSTGAFSIAENPARHGTFDIAGKEAERLAKLYTEKRFIVMFINGVVETQNIIWS